MKKFNNKINSQ